MYNVTKNRDFYLHTLLKIARVSKNTCYKISTKNYRLVIFTILVVLLTLGY